MAVDVDSFTDNNIINGTLSHTVTVTPATVIDSVSYRVENSTLSNEVSVDAVDYTVDDIENGVNITLKPHILRHEAESTGAADIVITITDKYGRSVNVTDHITIMEITNTFTVDTPKLSNLKVASTVDDFNNTDYYLTINANITPQGLVDGNTVNILDSFRGLDVTTTSKLIRTEFINNGEFVVTTSQPTQTVPTMTNGPLFVLSYNGMSYVNVPIALLSDFLPSTWDNASIFDNIVNSSIFKYKPNNSQLKLYTYNDGWDNRDYIIFNTADPTTARNISPVFDEKIAKNTVRTSNTTGCIAPIVDATGSLVTDEFRNGFTIPRLTDQEVTWVHTGQTSRADESRYGITYSSSDTSSSDKTLSSYVYMYAPDISNLLVNPTEYAVRKVRDWVIVINNNYQNNRPATKPEIATRIQGWADIMLKNQ